MNLFSLFNKLIQRLASLLKYDEWQIKNLQDELGASQGKQRGIFFVLRRSSFLQEAMLKYVYCHLGLPEPTKLIADDIDGGPFAFVSVIALRNRTGGERTVSQAQRYRKELFHSLESAFENYQIDQGIFIPISFFAGKGPSPWLKPLSLPIDFQFFPLGDFWLFLVFWWYRHSLQLAIGPSIIWEKNNQPPTMLTLCSRVLYQQEKTFRGAKIHSLETIQNIVLSGERFELALRELAASRHFSREQAMKHAEKIFREMVGTMRGMAISFFRLLLSWLFRKVFRRIEVQGLDKIRKVIGEQSVVLVPSHRSHFDYLLLSHALYYANLPLPYIAAGDNLNFFPVGSLLRSVGAFFVRRKIEADRLYKIVLENYLAYLVKQGHLIEFYIEGGRTRSGLIRFPRFGMLKYLMQCVRRQERSNLMFVPVSITYERVPEEKTLTAELTGVSPKKNENLLRLFQFSRKLKAVSGTVAIHFESPLSLEAFLDKTQEQTLSSTHGKRKPLVDILGNEIARRIADAGAVPSTALLAGAFLASARDDVSLQELEENMLAILQAISLARGYTEAATWNLAQTFFLNRELNLSFESVFGILPFQQRLLSCLEGRTLEEGFLELTAEFKNSNLISFKGSGEQTVFFADNGQRIVLEFYKNQLLRFLVLFSFAGLAFANKATSQEHDFERVLKKLHQMFQSILLLPSWERWHEQERCLFQNLERIGWITRSDLSCVPEKLPLELHISQATSQTFQKTLGLFLPYFEALYGALLMTEELFQSRQYDLPETHLVQKLKNILETSSLSEFSHRAEVRTLSTLSFAVQYLLRNGFQKPEIERKEQLHFVRSQIHLIRGLSAC